MINNWQSNNKTKRVLCSNGQQKVIKGLLFHINQQLIVNCEQLIKT